MDLALAGRLIAACIVIGAVLVSVGALSRLLVRGRATSTPGRRLIAVLETAMLPNGASLHVVRVADRYYAVGRSGSHLATFAEIAPESVLCGKGVAATTAGPAGRFAALFSRSRDPHA